MVKKVDKKTIWEEYMVKRNELMEDRVYTNHCIKEVNEKINLLNKEKNILEIELKEVNNKLKQVRTGSGLCHKVLKFKGKGILNK